MGGAGTGSDRQVKLDRKDCRVDKLDEKADVIEFRQWIRTVELQLECVYNWQFVDVVFQELRRAKAKVDEDAFDVIITSAAENSAGKVQHSQWDFDEKSRFLYNYLLGKLNRKLYSLIVSVENQNGFEVFRIINAEMDAIPENAKFQLDISLSDVVKDREGKVVVCKSVKDTHTP